MTVNIPKSLEYVPPTFDTPRTRRQWERALPPLERILFPTDLTELRGSWLELMDERRLSVRQLADATGIAEPTLRSYLSDVPPTVDEADTISTALGVSPKRFPKDLRRR